MKVFLIIATSISGLFVTGSHKNEGKSAIASNKHVHERILQAEDIPCTEGDDEDPEPLLSGSIRDNTMFHNPLYHACVELKTTAGVLVASIGSDISGHYYFNTVASGSYNLVVSASGFAARTVPVVVSGTPQNVNVFMY